MPVRMRGKSETALTTVLMWGKERGREKGETKAKHPTAKPQIPPAPSPQIVLFS